MFTVVIFHARMTQPLVLRFKDQVSAYGVFQAIRETESGELDHTDGCGTRLAMSAHDVVGVLLVDTAKDLEAKIDESVAQAEAQAKAQQKANASPIGRLIAGGGSRQ